jgi:hypothetical protein
MRRTTPMPSPMGTNREKLFIETAGGAYDAAPPRSMLAKACAWMAANGCSAADVAEFVAHMHGGGEAEEGEDETASEHVHNQLELAASGLHPNQARRGDNDPIGLSSSQRMTSGTADTLPTYKPNGAPMNNIDAKRKANGHALDESLAAARRIPKGPLGYA